METEVKHCKGDTQGVSDTNTTNTNLDSATLYNPSVTDVSCVGDKNGRHEFTPEQTGKGVMFTPGQGDSKDTFTQTQIIKNLVAVSIGFLGIFTAYGSLANLQSSLNMESGTGSGSLAVIYAGLIVSCLFLPPFMIAQLGCKWTMPICVTGYILYMVANFYPVWGTMVPTAVLIGLGAAPLWSAKCTYLTTMGMWYARMTGVSEDAVINRFFGIFFMFFQSNQIWGNILISYILSPSSSNQTDAATHDDVICGANFCPVELRESNNTNLQRPVETKIYILCGVYVGLAIVGTLIIVVFLDRLPLPNQTTSGRRSRCVSPSLFLATFRHILTSRYQVLLIPLTIYTGLEQAFIGSDFTRSYVTCTLGIQNLGYVMICYGVSDAVFSFTFGQLVKHFGHIPFFVIGFLLQGGCQLGFLWWVPSRDQLYLFYVFVGLWGMGDAVMQTQMNALYGLLFKDKLEAGFANYKLWESTGFIMQYAYNDFICTRVKLYISLAFFTVGIAGYTLVEILYHREQKKENSSKL